MKIFRDCKRRVLSHPQVMNGHGRGDPQFGPI